MNKKENYQNLKDFTLKEGASLFGIADLAKVKTDDFLIDKKLLGKLPYAISIGVTLSPTVLEEIIDHPTQLYFHHYRQINMLLDQIALKVTQYILKEGFNALPIAASQIVDWQNQKAHLSHKRIGVAAGLGWIGRNNLLVNAQYGSQFRLVSILTDLPLIKNSHRDTENTESKKNQGKSSVTSVPPWQNFAEPCGKCRKCIEVCPAQAIKDKPEDFQHLKCFEKLKEFQKKRYVGQYICGVCVKACSGNKKI